MKFSLFARDIKHAKKIQDNLKQLVRIIPFRGKITSVAGVDAAFIEDKVIATACLFSYPEIILSEETFFIMNTPFPYIPGFLSFREGPAFVKALRKLRKKPDIVLFDGQGIAHPQGLGIASHIGVILELPTIGCAKSKLVGEYKEPGIPRGSRSPLRSGNKTIGAVVRTRDNIKPVFVSPGHLIDLQTSITIVLKTAQRYRLPEPIRRADLLCRKIKTTM